MKPIRLTGHARDKFTLFARHGLVIAEDSVLATVATPEWEEPGHGGRLVRQRALDATHVLRVVIEETDSELVVVTFYPGRRSRYAGNVQPRG